MRDGQKIPRSQEARGGRERFYNERVVGTCPLQERIVRAYQALRTRPTARTPVALPALMLLRQMHSRDQNSVQCESQPAGSQYQPSAIILWMTDDVGPVKPSQNCVLPEPHGPHKDAGLYKSQYTGHISCVGVEHSC